MGQKTGTGGAAQAVRQRRAGATRRAFVALVVGLALGSWAALGPFAPPAYGQAQERRNIKKADKEVAKLKEEIKKLKRKLEQAEEKLKAAKKKASQVVERKLRERERRLDKIKKPDKRVAHVEKMIGFLKDNSDLLDKVKFDALDKKFAKLLAKEQKAALKARKEKPPREGLKRYTVSGTLDIKNGSCKGKMPKRVWVYARLLKGKEHVEKRSAFAANGPFTMKIDWPKDKGKPEAWRIKDATRKGGSPICANPKIMTCPVAGKKCRDTATKVRRAPIGSKIDYRVRCNC